MINAMFSDSLKISPCGVGTRVRLACGWQVELELCQELLQHVGAG